MLVVNEFLPQVNTSIFDTPEFFRLHQGDADGYYFQWVKKGRAIAGIHFVDAGDTYRSPRRGTFGGVFAVPNVEFKDILDLTSAVIERLDKQGKGVDVAMAPEWHDPRLFANQFYALNSQGFVVSRNDLDFGRAVTAAPFLEGTSPDIRRRNAPDRAHPFVVGRTADDLFAEAYDFIRVNHEVKGYPVSMNLVQLDAMRKLFPTRLAAYTARREGELVAAAICILVRPSMQHIFLMNNKPDDSMCNTVGLVVQKIYEDCLEAGVSRLSYGTATENRIANEGLIRFKRSLGFVESLKLSLSRKAGKRDGILEL